MTEVNETPKLSDEISITIPKAIPIPETIPVDAKLISMIQEHDRLFDLTWGGEEHPEENIHDWEEQSEKIVEYIRRKMGLPHHFTVRDQ